MRKVIVSNLMSLDGFFEGPNHELDWFVVDEEFFAYARDMLRGVDTILIRPEDVPAHGGLLAVGSRGRNRRPDEQSAENCLFQNARKHGMAEFDFGEERCGRGNFEIETAARQGHGDPRKRQPRIISPATGLDRRIPRHSQSGSSWQRQPFVSRRQAATSIETFDNKVVRVRRCGSLLPVCLTRTMTAPTSTLFFSSECAKIRRIPGGT
jgi:hypothetical protein